MIKKLKKFMCETYYLERNMKDWQGVDSTFGVNIWYKVDNHGSNDSWYEQGDPVEITIWYAEWDHSGMQTQVTDEEEQIICQYVWENPPELDDENDYDRY